MYQLQRFCQQNAQDKSAFMVSVHNIKQTCSPSSISLGPAFVARAVSSAREPIAACTVALGSQARGMNSFSFKLSPVCERQNDLL